LKTSCRPWATRSPSWSSGGRSYGTAACPLRPAWPCGRPSCPTATAS